MTLASWISRAALLAMGGAACSSPPATWSTATLTGARINDPLGPNETVLPLLVDIKEFPVTTKNALPHDVALAPDGSMWVTEQKANMLGRFDPATWSYREVPLPTPDSGPHGLLVDARGDVWFTALSRGYIGRLDPRTGKWTSYAMPDSRATDPHTPVMAADGTLWFTVEQSNFVGKLNTKTGNVQLTELHPHAHPHGIVLGIDGTPYVCESGTNKLARIEAGSMRVTEISLPAGARPRRIALSPDGTLFYTDYERGKLGRLEPRTGKLREWPSPGGPSSKPLGIAVTPDRQVWYSEAGPQPNTLVRFRPESESFAATTIPTCSGGVRNMTATADGRLFFACSGTNRVAIATPQIQVSAR